MSTIFELKDQSPVAFVPTRDPDHARSFYRDVLGLELVDEQLPFALVFLSGGIMLRVTVVQEFTPAPFTILGWEVPDIESAVTALGQRGVHFIQYAGLKQDALQIWTAPGGAKVAWFHDPAGNTLSVSQH